MQSENYDKLSRITETNIPYLLERDFLGGVGKAAEGREIKQQCPTRPHLCFQLVHITLAAQRDKARRGRREGQRENEGLCNMHVYASMSRGPGRSWPYELSPHRPIIWTASR